MSLIDQAGIMVEWYFSVLVAALKIIRFRKIFMGFGKPGSNSCEAHSFATPTAKN